ncbi:hypothetical protein FF38_14544, partial [Lucilia cuprina]
EAKKPEEKDLKTTKEKDDISEVKAEKAEEKKLEAEAKKPKEKELKATKDKAEISEVKAEKVEENKVDAQTKTAEEKDLKSTKDKAEISEAKAAKLEEKKIEVEAKNVEEKDVKTTKEMAEISEINAEKAEAKKLKAEEKKADEKDVNTTKEKAEISQAKAEKVEEKKLKAKTKKTEEKDVKTAKEKAEISEVKTEKLEEKKLEAEAKKAEEKDLKTSKERAEIEEKQAEETKMKTTKEEAEKLKEKKLEVETKKTEENELETSKEKAEISEVKAEKEEEKEVQAKAKKPKEKDLKSTKAKAEVKAENLEQKKVETDAKNAEERDLQSTKEKAEVSEVKAEAVEEKKLEAKSKKAQGKELKTAEEKAEISEVKGENIEEEKLERESAENKAEIMDKNLEAKKLKSKDVESEKLEDNKLKTKTKKSKQKEEPAAETKAEIADVEKKQQKEEDNDVKAVSVKTEISEVEQKKSVEVKADKSEDKTDLKKSEVDSSEKLSVKESDKPKKSNEYMDLKEQRNAKRMPSVDIKLTNRNSSVGSDIKLTCGISGNDVEIRWFKENTAIENNAKYRITQKDGLSCLEIKSADLQDAAVYRCVAANRNGEVETSCLVTLYDVPTNKFGTPPIFTRNIRECLLATMGETEGETTAADGRGSEEPEAAPAQDTLQVPAQKKRKLKSPTPGSLRGRSATPIRGRSQTPFTLYMTRRSATPSTWRSITPFLKREEKEKTPFELGRDLRTLLTCNTAVFDRALVMDISEPIEAQKPVRYITSDLSVIDRAAVMDVSNVEVIYVVEEYEEYEEEEEEIIEEVVKPKKKPKGSKKGRTPRRSAEKDGSPAGSEGQEGGEGGEGQEEREESVDLEESDEPAKKGKKKGAAKKKEKKEKSPSPKLSLKLEMGGGQKASKKMFDEKQQQPAGPAPRPPPKKSKLALQMEEQAKAAAKAAEEEAAKAAAKKPVETFEERQKRLKAEQEEREREEAERRAQEEAEAALAAEEAGEEEDEGGEGGEGDEVTEYDDGSSRYDESRYDEESRFDEDEEMDEVGELPNGSRRSSNESEGFTRPDPDDEERWKKIAEEEGEEFMQQMRKYSLAVRKSEKQRDAEWQRLRDQRRLPHFIVFLSDRTVEAGHNVRLACAVGGPELSVKWFKDGRQLERDNTHRIINNNNMLALEVINTTILDSGEYSCVIANVNDEVTSSCYVTIYEVFKDQPAPPSFRLVKEYYHLRDDELTIEVHVHGVPRPVVTWWKGAFEIKPNVKFTKLEEAHGVYKLLIYKPNNRDSGVYTCKAINSSGEAQVNHAVEVAKNLHYHVHGIFHARDRMQRDKEQTAKKAMEEALKSKGESDKKRAQVEVRSRGPRASPETLVSDRQKLKFATQLRDRMALEGSTVKLVVTIIGPDPACRWMKDDKWVTYNDKVKNRTEADKAIIELIDVTSENSGVYKCVAKNEFSEIETSCYFKVYAAQAEGDEHEPIFALPLRDVYHSSQNDLILDTKIRGNPRPVVTWIKDQIPVVLDDRIVQIEHLDGICELIINKPTANDSGNYTCVAQNKLGTQQTSHSVVVDVHQSRRSSVLSGVMSDSDAGSRRGGAGAGGEKAGRPPKSKKKDEEGDVSYERRSRMPDPSPKQQLYFTTYLSNRYVLVGSKVKLQSVVNGPNPTMKWTKDEQNVPYGNRIRNMNREGLACLEFLNCQPEDSGIYTLIAQNEFSKITSSCQLHVYTPNVSADVEPVFVRPIKDTYHLNSNELILETGIRGVPPPQIQWLKDNIEIENAGRFHIFQHADGNLELVIDSPNDKDSGKYIVRAESSAGKAEIAHHVLFRGKEHHIADNIHGVFHADKSLLKPKREEVEKPKETAKSEAESEGEEGSKGKKRVRKPKKDDEEAEASSASAYATDTGSETSSLKKREKVIGIHFATAVRDRVVAEGSKVKISCFLEAKEPQVKWFKNDEQIQNSQKIRGRYVEGLCTLEIPSAAVDDSGEYKCWARDETGEASTFCRLEVYSDPGTGDVPPTFTRNIKDTYHGKINEVQLDCHVRGLPTPTVTWSKDGVKIEPSEKYQTVEHEDGTLELFIMDPTPNDSGKYVCQAENREGQAEIAHMVTVQPRRRRPVSPSRDRPPALPPTQETEEEKEKKRKKKEEDEEGGGRRREVPPPPDLKKRIYFRNFLSNRTVKAGSNVKWMVSIDGPDPTARWFHGDNPIAFGPKSKLSMQDGIAWLNLIDVTEEQSGVYTLKVKGSENEIVSTCTLFVYSTGKEELVAPTFTVGIKDAYHSHENHITLECKVSGNPKPNVYWQKDNTLLSEEGNKYKFTDLQDGVRQLIIQNPIKEDTGLYTCYAESESGQMKISKFVDISDYMKKITERRASKSCNEQREVGELEKAKDEVDNNERQEQKLRSREAKFKLNVETPMKPMTIASGTKAQLICYVSGLIEDVYWLRGDERVTKDSRHKIYNINGALSLEIYDARPDDTGEYKCVVRNNRNSTESICKLTVYDSTKAELPTSFSGPVTATFDAARSEIILSCNVHGRPCVTWIRDDHTISNNRYRSVEEIGGVRKLIIRNPIPSDCGTFSCFAETNEGIESITKVIKIADLKKLMTAAAETEINGFSNTSEDKLKRTLDVVDNDSVNQTRLSLGRSTQVASQRKPLFSTLLHDRTVAECSNVRLSCSVVYDGCTSIEWLKDNQPLPKDTRYQTIFHNGEAILEIFAAQESDSGRYTCRATNDYGESLSQSQLRIYKHYEDAPQPATFVQSIK